MSVPGALANAPMPDLSLRHGYPVAWRRSGWICLALTAVFALLMLLDDRTLLDVSVWLKPLKFHLSIGVYFLTLVLLAAVLPVRFFATVRGRIMVWTAILCTVFELGYITLQAGLGDASHFNGRTPLHATMYSLMGVGAVLLVTVVAWLGIEVARLRGLRSPLLLSIFLGTVLTFALGGGFGGVLGSNGGHWVGACGSDAGGLPFVGWSAQCGDLRVSHFLGMHAMQVIPLLGYLAHRWLSRSSGFVLVLVGSAVYALFSTLTFLQALDGQPLLSLQ